VTQGSFNRFFWTLQRALNVHAVGMFHDEHILQLPKPVLSYVQC